MPQAEIEKANNETQTEPADVGIGNDGANYDNVTKGANAGNCNVGVSEGAHIETE